MAMQPPDEGDPAAVPVPTEPSVEVPEPAAGPSYITPAEPARGRRRHAGPERAKWFRRKEQPAGPRKHHKSPWWEFPLLIGLAVVVAMVIKTFLVQPYYIPSPSMEKTLHGCTGCSGDRILVNKPIFELRSPHPGDIVVFKAPTGWDDEPTPKAPSNPVLHAIHWAGQLVGLVPPNENDLVKRVIAVGGQTVQCCDANGNVQISQHGTAGPWVSLNEPYIDQPLPWTSTDRPGATNTPGDQRTFGPVTVPKGRLWVMGDNRAVSADSRYHYETDYRGDVMNSTVPVSSVIGKAVLIVWPPSRWRTLGTPSTFKHLAEGVLGTPAVGGAAAVLPLWFVRRRKRRR